MDPVTTIAFDLSAAVRPLTGGTMAPGGAPAPAVFDVAHFNAAYSAAGHSPKLPEPPKVSAAEAADFGTVLRLLEGLNGRAESLGTAARQLQASQQRIEPGELLQLTMQAHEFLFHCELTSNVANRTSDGVQQLFREQS